MIRILFFIGVVSMAACSENSDTPSPEEQKAKSEATIKALEETKGILRDSVQLLAKEKNKLEQLKRHKDSLTNIIKEIEREKTRLEYQLQEQKALD